MNLAKADLAIATMKNIDIAETAGTSVDLSSDFSEIDIFCLLLAKFGHPNGPMTMSIPYGDPDAPWKWDFIFKIPELGTLEVCRSWKHLEIRTRKIEVNPNDLTEFLLYNLHKYKDKIRKVKNSLEDYRLLINPYKRHEVLAKFAKEELDLVNVKEPFYPESMAATPEDIERHNKTFIEFIKSMDKESASSISLCTHSAFMVEAYLNLIIAILIKEEVKEDKAIFKETIERTWRKKVKRLHLDCNYISKIDFGNSIIRDIATVFDLRNKVAHSYPHKEDLTVSHMWFFKNFPILNNPVPFDQFQIAINNRLPTREQAYFCYETASKMIEFIDKFIDENIINNFKFLSDSNPIGFNESKGMYSVPFGKTVFKGFMSQEKS